MFATKRPGGASSSPRRPQFLVAACCLSVFVAGISTTTLNVALPTIRTRLHASVSGLQWTVDAYSLVIACLLLLAGSLADRYGRRKVFLAGLVVFTAASAGCGLAPSLGWLIALRVVQAVGGSMLNPVALSIITDALRDPAERARAIGTWGAVFGLSVGLGPAIGGLVVSAFGWRYVFLINVPLGLLAIVLTTRYITESRATEARRLDPAGQLLFIVALAALTYGVIESPGRFQSPMTVASFAILAIAVILFVAVELRSAQPLIDVRYFRSPPLTGASLIAVLAFGVLAGFSFLSSLYLQQARGLTAVAAGLALLPMAGSMAVLGLVSGRVVARRGPLVPLVVSGLATAVGCAMLSGATQHTPLVYVLAAYAVVGVGLGMVNPPISTIAVSSMPSDQSGVAASIASTSRQAGGALGVAVVGLFVATSAPDQFAHDDRPAWLVLVCSGVAIAALGLLSTGRWARNAALRNADRMSAGFPRDSRPGNGSMSRNQTRRGNRP
ncbi:MFS transporter [Streptomyces sp. RKCA744]|uniref:MFS transporter n=1 Tax=Streptomyces sp. RKCA744 TaxID=2959340 RepID=UPI0020A09EE7|nr:MFS transporter [Streptomyces sp. RKCA744]MCO8308401.1 MFS transporter [Streptomyces sp. RKCA744]